MENETDDETDIDIDVIKKNLKSIPTKYITVGMLLCLLLLVYYLGFIYGYNDAFHKQKGYYEEKMLRFCFCQDEPTYDMDEVEFPIMSDIK